MAIIWNDLTRNEQIALKRISLGPYPTLTSGMADRLEDLGLTDQKQICTGISKAGVQLLRTRRPLPRV